MGQTNLFVFAVIYYKFYCTVELANNLNDPEGFLIQARNGTEDTSEIIGTFLYPDVVRARDPNVPINYKILSCNRSISDMESQNPLPVSGSYNYIIVYTQSKNSCAKMTKFVRST